MADLKKKIREKVREVVDRDVEFWDLSEEGHRREHERQEAYPQDDLADAWAQEIIDAVKEG